MTIARRPSLRFLGPLLGDLMEDLALIGGAALIAYGVWGIYRPAGFIAAGILLIGGSILKARGTV